MCFFRWDRSDVRTMERQVVKQLKGGGMRLNCPLIIRVYVRENVNVLTKYQNSAREKSLCRIVETYGRARNSTCNAGTDLIRWSA